MRLRPAAVVVRPRVDEGHLEGLLLGPRRAAARERERRHGEREHEPAQYELPSHLLLLSRLPTDRATIRQRAAHYAPLDGRAATSSRRRPRRRAGRPRRAGGRVLSVFTREWLDADVAVVDGVVAGVGSYEGRETLDASGRYVVPGFIDAHMHLESVKLMVDEFARLVLPLGTTAVVADPHEIANVLGVDGVHWLLDATRRTAARRLLHGVVVRSRLALRVAAATARTPAISSPSCAGGACSGSRR